MRTRERGSSLCRGPWWLVVAFACSFDSSGEGMPGETLANDGTTTRGDESGSATTTGTVSEATDGPGTGTGNDGTSIAEVSTGTTVNADSGDEDTAEPSVLDDDGLVVRYYLDEAGATPNAARDADPIEPFDLVHDWGDELSYVTIDDNRGLQWTEEGVDGGPSAPVDGFKVRTRLEGETTATIEVVADIQSARDKSRIVAIGKGNEDVDLGLLATDDDRLYLRWRKNENAAFWDFEFSGSGRKVFHVVLDASEDDDDRVRLYVDGNLRPVEGDVDMDPGVDITFENGCDLILGNRPSGGHSFKGVLYYAALYATAFDEPRVMHHQAILHENDDTP